MSRGLAALGSLADGIAQGMVLGRDLKARDMALEQQKRQMDEQAALAADMKDADQAARELALKYRAEHDQQYKGLGAYMTRGGSDGSLADAQQDAVSQPVPEFKATPQQMLKVAQARTARLFEKGRTDQAFKYWMQDEGLRRELRGQAGQDAMAALSSGGDATKALSSFYDLFDNGHDITSAVPQKSLDGGSGYLITRRGPDGKEVSAFMTPDEIGAEINKRVTNWQDAAKESFQHNLKLAAIKAQGDNQIRAQNAITDRVLSNTDAKGQNALTLQDSKNAGTANVANINANSREKVAETNALSREKVASMKEAMKKAGVDGEDRVHSVVPNGNGTSTVWFRSGKKVIDSDNETLAYTKFIGQTAGQISKTLEGSMAPYEKTLGEARRLISKSVPAGSNTPTSGERVDPARQAVLDADRVRILKQELAKTTDPTDRAALERELGRATGAPQPSLADANKPKPGPRMRFDAQGNLIK